MRQTKARHHKGDVVVVKTHPDDPLAGCSGLRVRITDLYWEEDAWGYGVSPVGDASPAQARMLMMVTLHDGDFAA